MKRTNLSKVLMAWMLLITFTTVLAIKDLHFHDYKGVHVEKLSAKGNAQVDSSCFVCDFTMHKASAVKLFSYVPMTVCTLLHKPKALEPIIVYRSVESVNAHAPPFSA
ncbi:MAG: hypothetical protein HXN56_00525 [Prevotella nigrescens]|uniref:hypothetical protein n=1 Tax=Prevotella nigrescens TaxID=28133 RepID=UPI001CB57A04|nr:hypothetical protein [Prevotella nigrescens]MBF1455877.1 hypothetical protein [Prevotella nigrescens]